MSDLIGRKSVKLYQAKIIRIDDTEEQREFARSCEVNITLNQAWQMVVDKVKKALLRDIERHIDFKATDNGDGTILTEAAIWIEVPEGGGRMNEWITTRCRRSDRQCLDYASNRRIHLLDAEHVPYRL